MGVAPASAIRVQGLVNQAIRLKRRCPTSAIRLTTPQQGWLSVTQQLAIWRAGNQLGKSFGQAYDIALFATGRHPNQTHRPPTRILVVSYSWEQMDPLLGKLWDLLPKGEIDPKVSYQPGAGLRGYKVPHIKITAGPGAGSVIFFATYKQGAKRIAGGTFHRIYLDEPCDETIYGEIRPRLNRHRGHLRISFTPTPDSPPLDYLRDKVEKGEIYEHHTALDVHAVTPRGSRLIEVPWMTQADIDAFARDCLDVERLMRMEGAWEPLVTDRWLTNFSDLSVGHERPPAGAMLGVGIDHGAAAGKQAAALVAVVQEDDLTPRVWVIDEVVSDGYSTPEQDARAILEMLRRNGYSYLNVDRWVGDRDTGRNRYAVMKSNGDLRKHLARIVGIPYGRSQWIDTPNKWSGSVTYGFRLMNAIMGRKREDGRSHWQVNAQRCPASIDAYKAFRGDRRDPHKDILDAQRYAVEAMVQTDGWFAFRAVYA